MSTGDRQSERGHGCLGCGGCSGDGVPTGGAAPGEHLNCFVVSEEGEWWQCDCGRPLPEAAQGRGTEVACECGLTWRYECWPIGGRAAGELTELEPRRLR